MKTLGTGLFVAALVGVFTALAILMAGCDPPCLKGPWHGPGDHRPNCPK